MNLTPEHDLKGTPRLKLGCIIITFNPEPEIFQRELATLNTDSAVDHLVIVDNGSGPSTLALLHTAAKQNPRIELLLLGENQGIAAAQNQGVERVRTHNCNLLLFLDHDSVPSSGLILAMRHAMSNVLGRGEKIAAIGARTVDPRSDKEHGFAELRHGLWRRLRCKCLDGQLMPCEFLNASGSMIHSDAWDAVGKFDECLFIDHVETEWYLRARWQGYRCYGLCTGEISHLMGDDVIRFWLCGWRTMPRRSPQRHYTIVRNSLWLYRRPYVPLIWKLNNALKLLFTFVYFSLFDHESAAQRRHMLAGAASGLAGPDQCPPPPWSPIKNKT